MTDLIAIFTSALTRILALVPLTVYPSRGHGFAASIVVAAMAMGLLIVVAKFATTKPKNRRRPPR